MKFILLTLSHALRLQGLKHLLHGAASSLQEGNGYPHNLMCCRQLTAKFMQWDIDGSGEVTGQLRQLKKQEPAGLGCVCRGRNPHLPLTWLTCWDPNKLRGLGHVGGIDMWKIKYGGETLLL